MGRWNAYLLVHEIGSLNGSHYQEDTMKDHTTKYIIPAKRPVRIDPQEIEGPTGTIRAAERHIRRYKSTRTVAIKTEEIEWETETVSHDEDR